MLSFSVNTGYSSEYTATSRELFFDVGVTRKCATISVMNDNFCEAHMNDTFTVSMTTSAGRVNVLQDLTTAEVVIVTRNEPECGTKVQF